MKSRMAVRLSLTAIALALSPAVPTAADAFDQKLELQGVTFHVTGGTHQIPYKLAAGEAGWLLRADKVVEY